MFLIYVKNIVFVLLGISFLYASEADFRLDGRLDPKILARKIREEFQTQEQAGLLHQAKEKHIVAFLGNTGAGKSTLINFLAGKGMTRQGGDVVLSNPSDPEAMPIGLGGDSETRYPKSIQASGLLFYDLPGFCDAEGSVRNLINAAFIRQILTEAASVRLVIVASLDEFTSARGEAFKRMLSSVRKLFDIRTTDVFKSHSVLVVTKSRCTNPIESADYLIRKSTKEYQELLQVWIDNQRFCHMCHADAEADWDFERRSILSLISESSAGKCDNVDISAVYPTETISFLEKMFYVLIEEKFDNYFAKLVSLSQIDEGIAFLNHKKREFWSGIDGQVSSEEAVLLLKPFCGIPYKNALLNIERDKTAKSQQFITNLTRRKEDRTRGLVAKCRDLLDAAVEEYQRNKDEPV